MMISGANNLYNNRKIVDELNVFPVPDGDTGTNMSLTSKSMAKALEEHIATSLTKVVDAAANATLRGARGNSGVILSQFYRGMSKHLKGRDDCTALEFAESLKEGSDMAYKAVMNPTEGTILTVAREAASQAILSALKNDDIALVLEDAVKKGNYALSQTPKMLPALKQAGVVDAGGKGWMLILEGALEYIKTGEIINIIDGEDKGETLPNVQKSVSSDNIKYSYCTEFIVEKKKADVNVMAFRNAIEPKGDCMLVIDDDDIVKVHIHTNSPGFILERAVMLGDMINIKIDNMKHQHQSLITDNDSVTEEPLKEYGFIAVCAGDGMVRALKDLGISQIIEGGQTMNPSTEDILDAITKINAKNIFVFPNNKNIILAANQAKELSEKNVIVISTKSVPQCITAMLSFNDKADAQTNEDNLMSAIELVKTANVTYAVRDTEASGLVISEGDILGISNGEIMLTGNDPDGICSDLVDKLIDEDTEFITIYYGNGVDEDRANNVLLKLEEKYEDVEFSVKYGGQPLYYYIISAE